MFIPKNLFAQTEYRLRGINYICKRGYSETESGRTAGPNGAAESGTGEETPLSATVRAMPAAAPDYYKPLKQKSRGAYRGFL
jgi:hypothetical protein